MINKNYAEASVFTPQNLLREARRQKTIPEGNVPAICLLDPDGDIVDYLLRSGQASLCPYWACYHTHLYEFTLDSQHYGIIGNAVGASFAVLLAEQLFGSGCQLLISITSAGIINPPAAGSNFVLIDESLRDEGTSIHYLPPDQPAQLSPALRILLAASFQETSLSVELGRSWTTDAPYRETPTAISHAQSQGVTCVEMEAAALYAFAEAKGQKVVCYAHLTNTMAQTGEDFEKGLENGSVASLSLLTHTASVLLGGKPPSQPGKNP
ncbi:MAG: nucleoside phosphorylase [Bacteroidetes bacterium]|nr:nucleoside phosphorylase [Fibrella sp.]